MALCIPEQVWENNGEQLLEKLVQRLHLASAGTMCISHEYKSHPYSSNLKRYCCVFNVLHDAYAHTHFIPKWQCFVEQGMICIIVLTPFYLSDFHALLYLCNPCWDWWMLQFNGCNYFLVYEHWEKKVIERAWERERERNLVNITFITFSAFNICCKSCKFKHNENLLIWAKCSGLVVEKVFEIYFSVM